MKMRPSYVVNGALASAVLYFAAPLSRGDRGAVDWVVLGLIGLAVLWNLVRLGQRLYGHGGGRDLWHLLRTLLFWGIGLLNTLFIPAAEVGSWKNVLGWVVLALAVMDTVLLYRKERAATSPAPAEQPG